MKGQVASNEPIKRPGEVTLYIMLKTELGKANDVALTVRRCRLNSAVRVIFCDTITGPFDVIIYLGGETRGALTEAITQILLTRGIKKSTLSHATTTPL